MGTRGPRTGVYEEQEGVYVVAVGGVTRTERVREGLGGCSEGSISS